MKPLRLLLLVALLAALPARAAIETYEFSDPQLEQRYQELSRELRCPKCQNQDIADSNADIAADLRKQLYQQLEAGASDEQILQYMVDRYGEFVRYKPRFGGATAILWLAPALLLALAALIAWLSLRRRGSAVDEALSDEEQRRLRAMLEGEDESR